MINYLPYVFGLASLLAGLYLCLYSFRIYKPTHKTKEEKKRYEKSLEKFGTVMQICSVILILNGSYDLIKGNAERYKIGNTNSEWTSEDRTILIENCIRDSGSNAINYLQITQEYCDCSMNNIMNAMTKEQYLKSLTKPQEEQLNEVLPLFQDCLDEFRQRIDSLENQKIQ